MIIPATELERIHADALERVVVSCDEFHAHTAACLVPRRPGEEDALTIVRLVEHARDVNERILEIHALVLGKAHDAIFGKR